MKQIVLSGIAFATIIACSLDAVEAQRFRGRFRPRQQFRPQPQNRRPTQPQVKQSKPKPRLGAFGRELESQQNVTRHALLIATREYPNARQLKSLPGTNQDAERIRSMLMRGGFDKENITVIYDDAQQPHLRPKKRNIVREIQKICQKAEKDDVVLVMAAGHGASMKKHSFYCPGDATDAALSTLESARQGLISVSQLARDLSTKCKATKKLIVVDACRNQRDGQPDFTSGLSDLEPGVWLINSCSENQLSWMSDRIKAGERHAIFSYYFADGLAGESDVLGNNDGHVSLAELYSFAHQKTYHAAQNLGNPQNPELLGLGPNFTVSSYSSLLPSYAFTTSDAQLERERTAKLIAEKALKSIRRSERRLGSRFVRHAEKKGSGSLDSAYEDHANEISFALGAYANAALELDPNCRHAYLSHAFGYRASGKYEEALNEFKNAGEFFELYVKGDLESLRDFLAFEKDKPLRDTERRHVFKADTKTKKRNIRTVPLFAEPDANAKRLPNEIRKHSKIRVKEVRSDWLLVSAVNDEELDTEGWIHQDNVHWFKEAADLYTPNTPMYTSRSGLGRLEYSAARLEQAASRFDLAAQQINQLAVPFENAANRIQQAGNNIGRPISRINGILGSIPFVSVPTIPNYPANFGSRAAGWAQVPASRIRQVGGIVQIPANYMRVAQGYVKLPAQYSGISRNWAQSTHDYYQGVEKTQKMEKRRNKRQVKHLAEITPRNIPVRTVFVAKKESKEKRE